MVSCENKRFFPLQNNFKSGPRSLTLRQMGISIFLKNKGVWRVLILFRRSIPRVSPAFLWPVSAVQGKASLFVRAGSSTGQGSPAPNIHCFHGIIIAAKSCCHILHSAALGEPHSDTSKCQCNPRRSSELLFL